MERHEPLVPKQRDLRRRVLLLRGQELEGKRRDDTLSDTGACRRRRPATYACGTPRDAAADRSGLARLRSEPSDEGETANQVDDPTADVVGPPNYRQPESADLR